MRQALYKILEPVPILRNQGDEILEMQTYASRCLYLYIQHQHFMALKDLRLRVRVYLQTTNLKLLD